MAFVIQSNRPDTVVQVNAGSDRKLSECTVHHSYMAVLALRKKSTMPGCAVIMFMPSCMCSIHRSTLCAISEHSYCLYLLFVCKFNFYN